MTWGEDVEGVIFIHSKPVGTEVAFWRLKISSRKLKRKKDKINIALQALIREEIKQKVCRDMKGIYEISFRRKNVCTDKSN